MTYTNQFNNILIMTLQITIEYRFVMCNTVSQLSNFIDTLIYSLTIVSNT